MTRADLPAVTGLEHALFGDEAWTEGMLAAELDGLADGRYYLVAEDTGALVGYAGLLTPGGGQADVLTLAVAEDRWGQRIGAALLDGLLSEAARRGCTEVFLEVRVDNDRAQRLYRGRGFNEIGIRRGYYQPSGTDALVMRLNLPRAGTAGARPGASGPGAGGVPGAGGGVGAGNVPGAGGGAGVAGVRGAARRSGAGGRHARPAAGGAR
jgi:ribosomal-protein-alanine N-acetyltransferase